ncbi:fasciclin domain-containing protein [Loktanella sp. F6476L]|uniref:fasciclin domain-containing protein n=1 Tax=Loktanella sp. F6476L TaxID=2926405 RepID=UPI001FF35F17|nr:fasciclin domain-containing protein [Loktanella sp. F6476L]MCK0122343.1 fasciclin domain-containing protein [Loktanella sp. F6476L]UWR01345.1 fasciclin domain-containing protein [Rhodobacteraceae bacterium S2214]
MMNAVKTTFAALTVTAFAGTASADADLNVVENAAGSPVFTTLVAAADAAGLVDYLSTPEYRFTIFAPTDAAFAALPEGTVERLLMPENQDELRSLVSAHVVPALIDFSTGEVAEDVGAPEGYTTGTVFVDDAIMQVDTLEGADLLIDMRSDMPMISTDIGTIEDAILLGDVIEASNGIIHTIDTVLTPAN